MALEIFKLVGSIFVDSDEAEKSIAKTDKKAEGLTGKLASGVATAGKWALGIGAAAGSVAVAIGVKATGAAIDFQAEMSNVATLLDGDVSTRINELGENVKNLSKDTGATTSDLTDGLYQVISAFGDTADSMGILETAAKGAKAGNASTTDSINLLAAVTKGYGDTSEEAAQKASDLAFNTVKLGQTSFPELASAMGKVIPLASTMKVSQEELFGAMATLTGVTGGTAEVTTQLRGAIQGFMQPTTAMADAMKSLGYENGQVMIETLGLQGSLEALKDSVGGNEIAFAGLFGSVEAKNAVLALAGSQAENFTEKTNAMYDAVGATDAAFAKQTDNIKANWDKVKNTFNVLLIDLGERFLPLLNVCLVWVNDNLPVIMNGFEVAFDFIGNLITYVSQTIEALFTLFSDGTIDCSNAWEALMSYLKAIWDTYGQPVFNVVMEVVKIVAKFFIDNFDIIRNTVKTCYDAMKTITNSVLKPMFDLVMSIVNRVLGVFKDNMPAISSFFRSMSDTIMNLWNTGLKPTFEAIGSFITNTLKPTFEFVFDKVIKPVVQGAFGFIVELWNTSLKPVLDNIAIFLSGVFTGNWKSAWEGLSNIVKGVFSGLVTVVKTPVNAIIKMVNSMIGGLNKIKVPDWVPAIGGKGINIPSIPMLWKGTDHFEGGPAIVGELGPELVDLPRGARVTPNDALSNMNVDNGTLQLILEELQYLTKNLYGILVNALINGTKIEWNDRELARLVKKYA